MNSPWCQGCSNVKFLVKDFICLYLLNMLIDQVDTVHVGRYWSGILCYTYAGDLDVKVTDLEKFCVKVFMSISLEYVDMDQADTLHMLVDIGLKLYAVPSWPI